MQIDIYNNFSLLKFLMQLKNYNIDNIFYNLSNFYIN